MRLVEGSDTLHPVRWYPAAPDARWFPYPHAFTSSMWEDADAQFDGAGEVRDPCVQFVTCNVDPCPGQDFLGEPSWYLDGVPPGAIPADDELLPPPDCGAPVAIWAELIDRDLADARYGWWQLRCNPTTGRLERGPTTWRHRIEEDPCWEVQGKLGIPVPGTIVRIVPGCDGQPWHFRHDALETLVVLTSATPSVILTAGRAYTATLLLVLLEGEAGSQVLTGAFTAGPFVLVIDLRDADTLEVGARYPARLLGRWGGLDVYSIRSEAGGGGSGCTDCNVVREDVSDIVEVAVADYGDGTHLYIPNTTTGAVGHWVALTIAGSRGWVDLCTCTESWWCTPGGCVASAGRPLDATSGPWPSLECCVAACTDHPCCPGDLPPAFPPEAVLRMQSDCVCIDGTEGAVVSPDGNTFDGSSLNPCGSGMAEFFCHVECVEIVPGYALWRMGYSWEDTETPACDGASGVCYAITDGTRPFSCTPVDMSFPVRFPDGCGGCSASTVFVRITPE